MIIKQSRIRNLSKLRGIEENTHIRIGISDIGRYTDRLRKIGFSSELYDGQTVLPKAIGSVSRRNSLGDYIEHKDRKKEIYYRMIEWTYKQWAGRGQTKEVTESTVVPYERYPRTIIPPQSIELTVISDENELKIVSPEIRFSEDNEKLIVHVVNLFLEIFRECQILDSNKKPIINPELIRLNWEVLPKGKMPWAKRKSQVMEFIDRAKGENRKVVEKRLEAINQYGPDFTAIGNAGFDGYIVHGFIDENIYVLESIYTNNATYILEEDWESISQLTKAEILNESLHKERVIHSKNWYEKMDVILKDVIKGVVEVT